MAGRRLKLDVYRPAGDPEPGARRPAVLQIHGGAWVIGDKREQGIPLLRYLAARGWVGFNVNYRLSPGATFPDHLVDVKAALAWIRAHADEYGIDPDFVVVTGGSAGGHLTALMALTANDARYQPGFEHADTSLQAALPFYGVYDFTNRNETMAPEFRNWILQPMVVKAFFEDEPEKFAAASPLDQIHADAPPFLIVHGDKDTLAPVADARLFAEQLRATSRVRGDLRRAPRRPARLRRVRLAPHPPHGRGRRAVPVRGARRLPPPPRVAAGPAGRHVGPDGEAGADTDAAATPRRELAL